MTLRANDLKNLVKKVFEIDAYKSKLGDDADVVVLSFTVEYQEPAKDLENFVELGYTFVLDADVSPGETDDGNYKVFIELERDRHTAERVFELLEGIELLTGMPDMRFRYFKSFKSQDATLENLTSAIPADKESYAAATDNNSDDNYSNFFANSHADSVSVVGESITFTRKFQPNVTLKIVESGTKSDVHAAIKGPLLMENSDIAEVLHFTRYIGNYNISKIGKHFIFEKYDWAIAMERV